MATRTSGRPKSCRQAGEAGPARPLPHHAAGAPDRRQGDPAQAPEQDLLPDLRGRARGRARGRLQGLPPRLRLVLHLLPRPGALPRSRHDRHRAAAVGGRRRRRPQLRRPPDAVPLGPQGAEYRQRLQPDRHSVPPGGRAAPRHGCATPASRGFRTGSSRSRGTRWCSAPPATGPPAKGSSGRRSTPPPTSSCRWSSWWRTTATPSRCRSRSTRRAARSPSC